jgi:hypothetical protein
VSLLFARLVPNAVGDRVSAAETPRTSASKSSGASLGRVSTSARLASIASRGLLRRAAALAATPSPTRGVRGLP